MSQPFQWPDPVWLANLPESEKAVARTRLLIGLAGLYASQTGTIAALSSSMGMHYSQLGAIRSIGRISPEVSIRLENMLGRELFPRETFRPDIFSIKG